MAKLRNIRERLEAYTLERTIDHPSVEPIAMFENGDLRFRLADKGRLLYGVGLAGSTKTPSLADQICSSWITKSWRA